MATKVGKDKFAPPLRWVRPSRIAVAAVSTVLLGLATAGFAKADFTFAQFDQGSNFNSPFSFSNSGGALIGTTQGNFTFLVAGAPIGPQAATITLTSKAVTAAATGGSLIFQPIDGPSNTLTITRVSDNANLLSLTFTGALGGISGATNASLSGSTSFGDTLIFSSDLLNFAGITTRGFQFNLHNMTAGLSKGGNGFLNSFAADSVGGLSSNVAPALPEPGSIALLGIGLVAAGAATRRKFA